MALRRWIVSSLFVLTCALGCASSPRAGALGGEQAAPERERAAWAEYVSPHFIVQTDVAPDVARAFGNDLESTYGALEDVMFPRTRPAWIERIKVVAFRRIADLEQIGPEPSNNAPIPGNLRTGVRITGEDDYADTTELPSTAKLRTRVRITGDGPFGERPVIVVAGGLSRASSQLVQDHLIERMVSDHLSTAPAWLHLGVSLYYRSLQFGPESVEVGAAPPTLTLTANRTYAWKQFKNGPWQGVMVPIDEIPPVTQLVAAPRKDFYRLKWRSVQWTEEERARTTQAIAHAAGAWALVHMLLGGPPQYAGRLAALMEKVKTGSMGAEAWNAAFGDLDAARIEADFRVYLRRATEKLVVRLAPFTPRPTAVFEGHGLDDAEMHFALLAVTSWSKDPERAMRHLEAAREQAPGHPELLFWEAINALRHQRVADVERLLAAAADADPKASRYLRALVWHRQELFEASRGDAALRERLIEATDRLAALGEPRDFNNLGWVYALVGLPDRGLPLASRAVQLQPTCWGCFNTVAVLLYQKGRLDEAIATQRRAIAGMEASASTLDEGPKRRLQCFEAAAQAARDASMTPAPDCASEL